jgi:uncharacterized protein (TIGR02145 family)
MMRKFPFFILLICSFSFSIKKLEGQIPSNVPKSGLVAWYPFNGNANDESGSALNGKVLGAVLTEDRFNKKNAAYEFSKDKLIEIPNTEDKNLYPMTISLWYYVDSLWDGDNCALFSKYERASWNGYSIVYGDFRAENNGFGTESVFLRDFNNRIIGYYTEPPFLQEKISSKRWYHYVFTVNENGGKIYVDGKLISTDQWTGQIGKTTSNWLWKIGRVYAETNRLKVKIDDVGVWNRALTAEEVKNLYDGESTTGQPCSSSPTVKDIDGNTYNTVQIGGQCWTKENLKVTKYNDGSTIPLDNSGGTAGNGSGQTWSTLKTGARTVYGHDNNNLSTYGYLYNGYAASDSRNICPSGWHVPSLSEWNSLINYVGGAVNAMVNLKSSDSLFWLSPNNIKGANSTGFSALPSGLRHAGGFGYINWDALWWTSSTTGDRLHYAAMRNSVYNDRIFTFPDDKSYGFSIRCIKDIVESSTSCPGTPTVKDIDGNTYNTVQIGGQCWTKENLKVTKYSDGSTIPLDNSGGTAGNGSGQTWSTLKTGARTVYGHDNNNLSTYGYLYNWYAASDSRNICPSGWHLPSDEELTTLTTYLGGSTVAGGKLKASGSSIWENGVEASNSSGFTGLPSGFRSAGSEFRDIRFNTYFWSSSNTSQVNAWQLLVTHNDNLTRRDSSRNENGFSIRCVKDVVNNTPCPGTPTVKDIDGNTYNTLQIGEQCWTKENLKVTKYNDGSTIPLDNSGGTAGNGSGQTWSTLKTGARTVYGHDNNNLSTYGYLYNWYAASDSRNICPSGWHLPSDEELTTLTTYLGGSTVAGGKLKATGTTYWSNNAGASNASGFTALGSGFRSAGSEFSNIKTGTFFWSSSSKSTVNAWQLFLTDNDNLTRRDSSPNENGFSIRCIKNDDSVYPKDGLRGYWPFNGNANDESGNNNHGVVQGATLAKDRCDQPASAYYFRGFGNNDHIKVKNAESLKIDSAVSILLWYRAIPGNGMDGNGNLSKDAGRYTLVSKEGDGIGTPPGIFSDIKFKGSNNHVGFYNTNGCCDGRSRDALDISLNAVPTNNEWVFVSIVSRKSEYDLYINGEKRLTQKLAQDNLFSAVNDLNLYFGIYGFGGDRSPFWYPFNGELDDIAYYSRTLSSQEIKGAYEKSKCAKISVITQKVDNITSTGAKSGGSVSSTDNTSVTARGVCWNTTGTPTIQDSKTMDDSGYGSFESNLTYLQPNTLYYLRAYASTPNGTFYGNEITFKTKSLDSNAVVFFTPNVNISCDSIVEIPLLAYNFKGVLGAQGSLGWDASKLKFESIASFGPTSLGLTTNDFGLTDSQKGKISFIWNSINATTVTLPDSTALFVLKFKVIDTKLTIAVVKMNNDPIDIEVVDSNFDKMKFELGTYVINQICAKVSGNVQTSKSLNVPGVILTLSNSLGSKSAITDVNGNYSFSNISLANYTLTPSKLTEAKPRNGVSTLDIGLIQAHVLNKKPFQTPYQVIAADVNGSGTITAADIILIRRFILGSETNFGGKLYSFVDKKHVFTNPLNPFPFPQSININNTQNQVVGDFIGVKLGDVNFDNTPQNFVPKASRDRKIEFVYEIITPTVSKRSNEVIYRIKSAKQQELLGMQFTLNWDSKLAELLAVEHNPLGIFLANETGDNGSLGLSWNAGSGTPKMLQENEVVFEIRVKLNARYMSVPLNINDDLLEREAFNADFKLKELSLKLENVSNTVISTDVKLNVFPNPAQGNFTLNFNSNMAEKGYILLTDMLGRTLVNQEIQISKGMNNVMIDLPVNIVTGTHNLQLRTSNTFETVKILIDNNK